MIKLIEIDLEIKNKLSSLKLHEHQKDFADLPLASYEESKKFKNAYPRAIFNNDQLIGFIIYETLNEKKDEFLIWDFMIDKDFQNKGYGKKAMKQLINYIKSKFNCRRIEIAYEKSNIVVRKLYLGLGFIDTGLVNDDDECLMELVFN